MEVIKKYGRESPKYVYECIKSVDDATTCVARHKKGYKRGITRAGETYAYLCTLRAINSILNDCCGW